MLQFSILMFLSLSFTFNEAPVNAAEFKKLPKYSWITVKRAEIPWGTGVAGAKTVIKFLKSKGFKVTSQKGSHVKLKGPNGKTTIVPSHGNKDLPKGTLNSILKQAGIKKK